MSMSQFNSITSEEMRKLEQSAIRNGTVSGLALMERAAEGVVEAIFEEWPELAEGSRRAIIICGPGNNGGDGFVVARLLKSHGFDISVYCSGDMKNCPPDARMNFDRWAELGDIGGEMQAMQAIGTEEADLIVDALFGIGLSRPIDQYWREIIDKCDWFDRSVAIDIPSGLDADTGRIVDYPAEELAKTVSYVDPQIISRFDMTVTFHRPKPGHFISPCSLHCGKLVVKDIGL